VGACLLGFVAGSLSLLSPCVLPLLPVVLAGAVDRHPLGPVALASGLAVSSTAFGLAFAALGFALDREVARLAAAGLLVAFGAVLLSARLDVAFARATGPTASRVAPLLDRFRPRSLIGQAAIGALLGVLWTPCGGPTLGSSIALAAQRESLPAAAAVMAAYSAGAALPLLVLSYGSRRVVGGSGRLVAIARVGKPVTGALLVMLGLLTVLGADKALEAALVERMPAWLGDLVTRY
jgi:cytochrome c biogenesis protein CcdA